ncbi:DUF3592 domain-containing protein [Phytobacter massiliensis]|uniref:DUF3592 domain-containing protein n=1 Tax=Phytobacter massiliensis TaxID=1485952 RepID=UPI0002FA45C0|nr:DUF3592 domain-containing protein [Phytobacter massiliensis]
MQQDAKVFRRIFTALGIVMLLIAAAIFYSQFHDARDAVHTEGLIVDTVWRNHHPDRVDSSGTCFPVVAFRPTPQYTLVFESAIGSVFYEHSEGDTVEVVFPPGQPHKAEINSLWVNAFAWGLFTIGGVVFIAVALFLCDSPRKKRRTKRRGRK